MGKNSIKVSDVEIWYQKKTALTIPSLTIDQPGITAIIGPNGSGKSTLLWALAGFRQPKSGYVRFNTKDTFYGFEDIKNDVQLLSNDAPLYSDVTGQSYLTMMSKISDKWDNTLAEKLLQEIHIPMDLPIKKLSTGERAKLNILLVLPRRPKAILVDELTNDLDSETRKLIFRQLDEYSFENEALVLIATNIHTDMERYATYFIYLNAGKVAFHEEGDRLKELHPGRTFEEIATLYQRKGQTNVASN